ncbi:MAG: hypothetical protein MRZ79_22835 [Bacteroidia bacterium]|nr:hypothetical protein [Bacteroidia bacterium]
MKVALIISKLIQAILLILMGIEEIIVLQSGLGYRYHYLLILYFVWPFLVLLCIFEFIGFRKIGFGVSYIPLYPVISILLMVLGYVYGSDPKGQSVLLTIGFFISAIMAFWGARKLYLFTPN